MSHSVAFQSGTLQHLQKRAARCCLGAQPRKVSSLRAPFRKVSRRSSTLIKAEDAQEKGDKIDDRKKSEQTSKLVEGMKKGGIDQSTAQRILDTWEQTGATTTDALRKMLLGRCWCCCKAQLCITFLSDTQWGLKCVVGQVLEDRRRCTVPASLGWRSCIRLIQFSKVEKNSSLEIDKLQLGSGCSACLPRYFHQLV